ncbi:hypothetical protein EHS25_000887 [Saitozyma podzolica]|uniref:Uncharacterized protein n=1 Tax=Saitozyma podzolica TaxID=1890683 RepID=A0A427YXI6_9TREE|nr:hypothetical protein EHS25_000887 [Saitozyma podzolica]
MFALRELNQMEREMCVFLEWDLTILGEEVFEFEDRVWEEHGARGVARASCSASSVTQIVAPSRGGGAGGNTQKVKNAVMGNPKTPCEDVSLQDFLGVIDVNVTACFLCSQEAFRIMKSQEPKGGRIINNGSISAYSPRPNHVPYTMSKHAVAWLTKCLALDGRQHNIACSQPDIGNAQTAISRPGGMLQPNGQMMVEAYYDAEYAGQAVVYMASLPLGVNVLNQTLMATTMPFVGRG